MTKRNKQTQTVCLFVFKQRQTKQPRQQHDKTKQTNTKHVVVLTQANTPTTQQNDNTKQTIKNCVLFVCLFVLYNENKQNNHAKQMTKRNKQNHIVFVCFLTQTHKQRQTKQNKQNNHAKK